MNVKKAIIPAAGLGTRFLPVTKSMPKEMLPLVDTPAIHYVVEEAVAAGIDDIIIITGRGKQAVEDYFDDSPELQMHLKEKGKTGLLKTIEDISSMVNVHYIRQKEPKGLPDAILQAEKHIGSEPFAVLLGDDIIKGDTPCIQQLITVSKKVQASVIAVQEVPIEQIIHYGSIKCDLVDDHGETNLYLIQDIIEKPKPSEAPSNKASIGRYVFTPEIFDGIKHTKPTIHHELQIADSIKHLMQTQKVYASEFTGKRYDIGDKAGYVQAVIDTALEQPELRSHIQQYLNSLK